MKVVQCPKCNGKGHHDALLKNLGTCEYDWHIVHCEFPCCHNGIVNVEENYKITYYVGETKLN